MAITNSLERQKKNVNTLYNAISASTYKDEYLIYNYYGGTNDLVHDSSFAQMEAMYKSEKFNFDNIIYM